jgi:hypothetical protein
MYIILLYLCDKTARVINNFKHSNGVLTMGRPLNKKYFGNINDDAISTAYDDHIGGEGLAVAYVDNGGNYFDRLPDVTWNTPSIPSGVTANGYVIDKAKEAVVLVSDRGTGYQIGNILTDSNGTTWRVTKLRVLDVTITNQPASQAFDGGENLVWDQWVDDNWTTPTILRGIVSTGNPNYDLGPGAHPYNQGTSTYGVWDGYVGGGQALAPASLTITGGNNSNPAQPTHNTRGRNDTNGTGGTGPDNNGNGGTANFTYGVEAVELVSSQEYITEGSYDFGSLVTTGGAGTGAKVVVHYKIDSLVLTEPGSGYIYDGSNPPATTTTKTGSETRAVVSFGYENNQHNAIIGVDVDTSGIVDIVRQESATSFWVIRWDGPVASEPYLLDLAPPTANVGMYIRATDSIGRTYWVKKISGHRVTLGVVTSGGEFGEDDTTTWTFDAPVAGVSVKIRNA